MNNNTSRDDSGIFAGELVMRLPRSLQIWDLDALRDEFIQQEFLGLDTSMDLADAIATTKNLITRHKETQNPLDSGAYLAVYLIRLMHGAQAKFHDSSNNNEQCQQNEGEECKLTIQWRNVDQHKERIKILASYFDILPTVADRSSSTQINSHSHPLFWSLSTIQSLFPRYTHTYDLILHYQQMIKSEYEALKLSSDEFGNNVEYLEYLNMRINVLSRAFGVQASSHDNGAKCGNSDELSLNDEMISYETSNFGSSLNEYDDDKFKLRSMCPLLDMYNSHPNPNVIWRYDSETSSYTVHVSDSNIQPGQSIVVSYGKYTDGHLFSKFGYVNGDGSSSTEVSLAVFHRMIADIGLDHQYSQLPFTVWNSTSRDEVFGTVDHADKKKSLLSAKQAVNIQAKELIRYLIFDDGYRECIDLNINPGTPEEELKLLKLKHLIRLANYRKAWTVIVPPEHPDALPYQTSESSSTRNKRSAVGINANRIISICRLLSLRVVDIGGDAIAYLREGLTKADFLPEKHEDTLEYRSMMCVVRLCNVALGRYNGHDNIEPDIVGSAEWNAWYVIIGEIRALRILLQTSASEANRIKHKYQSTKGNINEESMQMRDGAPCPLEYSLPLLERI